MAVILVRPLDRTLSDSELTSFADVPTAIVSDELNRETGMSAEIRPIGDAARFVGEALTIRAMVGDNLALHVAASRAPAGSVLVIDAGGYARTAVWGEVLQVAAQARGVAAVVIDGVIRDRARLRRSLLPVFARGACPNGPHKGWGGTINGRIQCGGMSVDAGDVVIGDEDGIVIVPRPLLPGLLERCLKRLNKDNAVVKRAAAGESTLEILGLQPERQ